MQALLPLSIAPTLTCRDPEGGWSLAQPKTLVPHKTLTHKTLLAEAASRIARERIWEGSRSVPQGAVFLGGHWRIIKVSKDKNGRPQSCTLVIDDSYNVMIEGAKDRSPLREPLLGYELWRLADAIICTLVFPEETKKMREAIAREIEY